MNDRIQIIKEYYRAYAEGDRSYVESHITDTFTFSAPPDPLLDYDGYFKRCWPGSGNKQSSTFIRTIESGDEVVVTYERKHPDGSRGYNTEIFTFDRDKINRIEVYFGWTVA